MRFAAWALAVFAVFFLQGRISVLDVTPDLTAVLAYYAGMRLGDTRGLAAGLLFGGLQDVVAQSIVGPNLLGKGAVGFLSSSFLTGGVLRWTPTLGMVAIAVFTLADNAVVYLSMSVFDRVPEPALAAALAAVMQAILNAPLGIFIRPPHAD